MYDLNINKKLTSPTVAGSVIGGIPNSRASGLSSNSASVIILEEVPGRGFPAILYSRLKSLCSVTKNNVVSRIINVF